MATRKNRKSSRSNNVPRNNKGRFAAKTFKNTIGSRAEVFHGSSLRTAGGLKKEDLVKNKHGRIVSRKKQELGRNSIKRLKNLGFVAKKGEFKLFKKSDAKKD